MADPKTERFPYYKPTGQQSMFSNIPAWQLFEEAQGCSWVTNVNACLRNDKAPPPLASDKVKEKIASVSPKSAPPTQPKPEQEKGWMKLFNDVQRLSDKPSAPPIPKELPPFDIRDIPDAMKAMGFTIGAKFSRRWLDGRAYEKPAKGELYAADMVDTDTIKLSWLFGYKRVKARYDELLKKDHLFKVTALNVVKESKLASFLKQNPMFSGAVDTLSHCKGDIQELHKQFQFQKNLVSTYDDAPNLNANDLSASLGSFAFYAAIARMNIKNPRYYRYDLPQGKTLCTHPVVEITHIYVYAQDEYEFEDKTKTGQPKKSSQYLGHWNKTGLIVVKPAVAASEVLKADKIMGVSTAKILDSSPSLEMGSSELHNYVVDIGTHTIEKEVFYPIRNRDYRAYRAKHNRGGDFVIYSDLKLLELTQPIIIDLGEICRS